MFIPHLFNILRQHSVYLGWLVDLFLAFSVLGCFSLGPIPLWVKQAIKRSIHVHTTVQKIGVGQIL